MATIMTTQIARNSGARRPMVGEAIAMPARVGALPGEQRPGGRRQRQQQAQDDVALQRQPAGPGAFHGRIAAPSPQPPSSTS